MANVHEASEEDDGQWSAIVFEELPNESLEEVTVAQFSADPCSHQHEKRNHDAEIGRCLADLTPLSSQDLDSFLEIDAGNVETEDIAREAGDVG